MTLLKVTRIQKQYSRTYVHTYFVQIIHVTQLKYHFTRYMEYSRKIQICYS